MAVTYSITYKANGGTGTVSSQTKTQGVAITLRKNSFKRTGFAFRSWNTKADASGSSYAAGATYNGDANLSLYAIWNRTLTYSANGGTNAPAAKTAIATSNITITTAKPTRTGYTFKQWNTKKDGTGTAYSPGDTYAKGKASATLYAIWHPTVSSVAIGAVKPRRTASISATSETDDGTFAYFTVPYTVKGAANATVTCTVTCTTATQVSVSPQSMSKSSTADYSGTFAVHASGLSINMRHQFSITVRADYATATGTTGVKTGTRKATLTAAYFTLDVKSGGRGLGIGRAATRDALDIGMPTYVDKALTFECANIDRDGANPAEDTYGQAYPGFADQDAETLGYLQASRTTAGVQRMRLYAYNEDSGGNPVSNYIGLGVAKDGTQTYAVGDAKAFRDAISAIASTAESHSNENLDNQPEGSVWWGNYLSNSPDGGNGSFMSVHIGYLQLAYKYMSGSAVNVYARSYNNSAWSPWARIDNNASTVTAASSICTAGNNVTVSSASYAERGGMACFEVKFTPSAAISSGTTVFTMVSGKRPAVDTNGVDTSTTYSCLVHATGTVTCQRSLTSGTSYTYRATYLLA